MCTDSLGLPWTWPRACVMNGPLLGDRCWPGDRVVTWGLWIQGKPGACFLPPTCQP